MSEEPESKEKLKQQYGSLYPALIQILGTHDPIGLTAFGAPDDEYEPEVKTILPRLKEADTPGSLSQIISQEFVRWFNESIAGKGSKKYDAIAQDVWSVYQSWLKEQPANKE